MCVCVWGGGGGGGGIGRKEQSIARGQSSGWAWQFLIDVYSFCVHWLIKSGLHDVIVTVEKTTTIEPPPNLAHFNQLVCFHTHQLLHIAEMLVRFL